MKIGVIVDSFRVGFFEGVKKAAMVGAQGIQAYATNGELSPAKLTAAQRRETLDYVKSNGLVFSALCGDFGGHGFMYEEENAQRIEATKRIMDMSVEMECNIVTTHIGVLPADPSHPRYLTMQKACRELAAYGDRIGATLAVETGPEPAQVLAGFIGSLGAKGVGVNLDPANLAMVIGQDAREAAAILGPLSVHTHAKDGVQILKQNPEVIYGLIKHEEMGEKPQYFKEVVLGTGAVNFDTYLPALKAAGYDGFLTVEREAGQTPENDIKIAVDFLRDKLTGLGL